MNPMQMMQAARNPQQFLQQIASNNQFMSNPIMSNAVKMAQSGDMQGVEHMARNLCKEKGLDPDKIFGQLKNNMGM